MKKFIKPVGEELAKVKDAILTVGMDFGLYAELRDQQRQTKEMIATSPNPQDLGDVLELLEEFKCYFEIVDELLPGFKKRYDEEQSKLEVQK